MKVKRTGVPRRASNWLLASCGAMVRGEQSPTIAKADQPQEPYAHMEGLRSALLHLPLLT